MKSYKFKERLKEGLIKSRPNRFIMMVKLGNKIIKCHCPSTGRIDDLVFKDILCLLSKSNNKKRKTNYTVEAISLDKENKQNKTWIGINQVKINKYVEFFLKNNQFSKMVDVANDVQREKKLGKSRIDFLINKTYLEIKMPLIALPIKKELKYKKPTKFNSFDRLIKHFNDLSKILKNKYRAIIALCYMYNAKPFKAPPTDKNNIKIKNAVERAIKRGVDPVRKFNDKLLLINNSKAKPPYGLMLGYTTTPKQTSNGVEQWQINLKIDRSGVNLIRYFKLKLF